MPNLRSRDQGDSPTVSAYLPTTPPGKAPDMFVEYAGIINPADESASPYTGGIAGQRWSAAWRVVLADTSSDPFSFSFINGANFSLLCNTAYDATAIQCARNNAFPDIGTISNTEDASTKWRYLTYNDDEASFKVRAYKEGLTAYGSVLTDTGAWNVLAQPTFKRLALKTHTLRLFMFDDYILTTEDAAILEGGWTP